MKKLLYIIFIGLIISCGDSQKENKKKTDKPILTEIDKDLNKVPIQELRQEINTKLKTNLIGVWASKEYKEKLFKTNSIALSEKSIKHYTDIVFDGEDILHCNKPSFMEEHYLYIKSDSTVTDYNGHLIFTIISINNSTMKIKDSSNLFCSYSKVSKNVDLDRIYMEVTKGSSAIEKEWIAGNYKIKLDTLEFDAELMKNGNVISDLKFKWISPFSYLGKDIIEFRYKNDSTQLYSITAYSDTLIRLNGIENITEMDAPIISNGKKGIMKKN